MFSNKIDPEEGPVVATFALQEKTWWGTCHWLAVVTLAALEQFKNAERNGYPTAYFPKEVQIGDRGETDEECKAAHIAWEADLDKMVAAFRLLVNKDANLLSKEEERVVDDGLLTYTAMFSNLWD